VVAHIQHVRDVAGIDHVGLGGDFDGVDACRTASPGWTPIPGILAALMANGWTEADIRKLAGENVLRVMRAVEAVARAKANEPPGMAVNVAAGSCGTVGPEKQCHGAKQCQRYLAISAG
jgi:membrane dipeptidase